MSMFEVSVEETFSAGHALRGYKGKCENPHGHNYRVRMTLEGRQLDAIGLLYDFTHLKRMLREVIGVLDHQFLNDLAPFDAINPSAENLAKFFHEQTARQIEQAPHAPRIKQITVWETDETSATYTP
jgi:6-pyruvoyltetrahydropterin/6-carboxytetrahydropterin synthase